MSGALRARRCPREDASPCRVGALQGRKRKRGRTVLMLEEPCDLRRSVRRCQRSLQDGGGLASLGFIFRRLQNHEPALGAFLDEVVNQAKAIPFPHGQNLVFAVGIERSVGKFGGVEGVGFDRDFAARMPDPQFAAAVRRRQRHDQSAEHAGAFLGIPVRQKKAATVVDQQLVEFSGDHCVATTQARPHLRKDGLEVCRP